MSRPTLPHHTTTLGGYTLGEPFGEGNYGIIRIGSRKSTGEPVIVKELDTSDPNLYADVKREGEMMAALKHPNIIELHDRFEMDDRLFLVMQFAQGGDLLEEIMSAPGGLLSVADSKRRFAQLIMALEHMHKNNIIHRDIKPDNIFLDAAKNVLVGDMGLSVPFDPSSRAMVARAGTLHYAAPEAFLASEIYGPELDVWSAAVVLYVMMRGRYPFWGEDDSESAKAILIAEPFWPDWFPADGIDLLKKMFTKNPRKRITISKIKRHPFIRSEILKLTRPKIDRLTPPPLKIVKHLRGGLTSPMVSPRLGVPLPTDDRIGVSPRLNLNSHAPVISPRPVNPAHAAQGLTATAAGGTAGAPANGAAPPNSARSASNPLSPRHDKMPRNYARANLIKMHHEFHTSHDLRAVLPVKAY